MKRLTLLTIAVLLSEVLCAQPLYTQLDTLMGRNTRYYYSEWYDSCAIYYTDTASFELVANMPISWEGPNFNVLASEHRTQAPLLVLGLAALVSMDSLDQAIPTLHPGYAAEYLRLYQAGAVPASVLWEHQRFYPREMTLIDSVRWDTATPYILKVPKNDFARYSTADTDFTYCYVYEAYFPSPVQVDSLFYILGTHNGNCLEVIGEEYHLSHWPTRYCSIEERTADRCDMCRQIFRVFGGDGHDGWHLENFQRTRFSPFLPIVAAPE